MATLPMLGMFGGNFASAKVDVTGAGTAGNQNSVKVNATQASTFSVVIPKEITLEKVTTSEYKEDYTVEVTGNIAGNETVTVEPAVNLFDLTQAGKDNLTAEVVQNETTADYTALANGATKSLAGTVAVSGVTAGSWEGTFDFNISKN